MQAAFSAVFNRVTNNSWKIIMISLRGFHQVRFNYIAICHNWWFFLHLELHDRAQASSMFPANPLSSLWYVLKM